MSYNETSFRNKIKSFGMKAGRKVLSPALTMYYCLKDKDTPIKAKIVITGALAYFIIPTDLIADISPFIGFTDDLTVLITAFGAVRKYLKPWHRNKADEQTAMILREKRTANR